jgi:hypothetical protein
MCIDARSDEAFQARLLRGLVSAAIVSAGLLSSSRGEACTPPDCSSGQLFPASASLPENARGVLWMPGGATEGFDFGHEVKVKRSPRAGVFLEGVGEVKASLDTVGVDRFIRPRSGWKRGQKFTIVADEVCASGRRPSCLMSHIVVTPAAPLPRRLGALRIVRSGRRPMSVATWGGSCSEVVDAASVQIEVDLDSEAKPWADVLVYSTFVDGKEWAPWGSLAFGPPYGGSWIGRGRDELYAVCNENKPVDQGLPQGTHQVRMHAGLPDGSLSIDSEPLTVELSCDAPRIPGPSFRTSGSSDIEECLEPQMGVRLPSGPRSSCACRTSGGPSPEHWSILTWGALVGCLRRLKRRYRAPTGGSDSDDEPKPPEA